MVDAANPPPALSRPLPRRNVTLQIVIATIGGGVMTRMRRWVRFRHVLERTWPFLRACFSRAGLGCARGRRLIRGKLRRWALSTVPPLARALQRHYGSVGGCRQCGASCNLLFACPHWSEQDQLCTVYDDRPSVCRLFPITPGDLAERDLVQPATACGFAFVRHSAAASVYVRADDEAVPADFVPLAALVPAEDTE